MIHVQVEEGDGFVIARLAGELSGNNTEQASEDLHTYVGAEGAKLAVDLSGVTAIDSGGLSALMGVVTRARLGQGNVVLVSPTPFVSGVFSVTRLDSWFEICADMSEAAAKLAE